MSQSTVKVQVTETFTREYPLDIAGLGDFLAAGGQMVSIHYAQIAAAELYRRLPSAKGVYYWVTLDGSGLVYRVEMTRHGSYKIHAAAPAPGTELRASYVA